MNLFHTENLLNLSAFKKIPRGTVKELFIRFDGTAQAGKTIALSDLGTVRVNVRGTDRHNLSVELLSAINNLKRGVAEFSSATGGAFTASFVVPFHAWWDDRNGEYFNIDDSFIELRFPNLNSTNVASGTVRLYYIEAPSLTSYSMSLFQRNIQAGGAGRVAVQLEAKNISSLYVKEDTNVSNLLVTTDIITVNGTQADLKSYSNNVNRVETAISLYEVELNPYDEVRNDLNKETKVVLDATGAANVNVVLETFSVAPPSLVQESINYRNERMPAVADDVAS